MADIINLKQARKDRARREHETEADANRRRFGRTRAEKKADKDAEERARKLSDGQRLDSDKDNSSTPSVGDDADTSPEDGGGKES